MGFIYVLRLDEMETYIGLNAETTQRWRRIFWLLFIIERSDALLSNPKCSKVSVLTLFPQGVHAERRDRYKIQQR